MLNEPLIPLSQAPWHVPGSMRCPHRSTVVRWALRGVGRKKVKLETLMIGGRRYTSLSALARFICALSGPPTDQVPRSMGRPESVSGEKRDGITKEGCIGPGGGATQ